MRYWSILSLLLLLVACDEDHPSRPAQVVDDPAATHNFEISPARNPDSTLNVTVRFPLDPAIAVSRTQLVVADTGQALLPSPWGSLYKINGEIVFEGRPQDQPSLWELRLRFRNSSNIVCTSCEDVSVEYRLWD